MLKTGISYFGSRIQRHVEEDMKDSARHNCDFVVHTFSEMDLEYYKGTMKEIFEISHKAGLEVWVDPWAVGGVFGGENYSKFVSANLDVREVSAKGESLPAACLNNEKFRDFMFSWIEAALELSPDVFFWDEPHFYLYPLDQMEKDLTLWACRCEVCRGRFEKRFGYAMPVELNDDVKLFKEDSIIEFTRIMCDYVKTNDKHHGGDVSQGDSSPSLSQQIKRTVPLGNVPITPIKNALCLLPFKGALGGVMDWSKAAAIESLDIIGTDPYWRAGEKDVKGLVAGFSKKIYELAKTCNKEAQIWILNFRIKKGTEKDIETASMAAYDEGVRNIAAWSYGGTGCMSYLTSDDPQKVWDIMGETFKKLKKMAR